MLETIVGNDPLPIVGLHGNDLQALQGCLRDNFTGFTGGIASWAWQLQVGGAFTDLRDLGALALKVSGYAHKWKQPGGVIVYDLTGPPTTFPDANGRRVRLVPNVLVDRMYTDKPVKYGERRWIDLDGAYDMPVLKRPPKEHTGVVSLWSRHLGGPSTPLATGHRPFEIDRIGLDAGPVRRRMIGLIDLTKGALGKSDEVPDVARPEFDDRLELHVRLLKQRIIFDTLGILAQYGDQDPQASSGSPQR